MSGSLTARLLSTQHDVTVFEANDYVGGHANTVEVALGDKNYQVDTGFMVFNERTYPNFCRLLKLLGVRSQPSDMSFSVQCARSGIEYQGSSLAGLFAQKRNILRPTFLAVLSDIGRFNRLGSRAALSGELDDGRTVAQVVRQWRLNRGFVDLYLVPMAAAIWSAHPGKILEFPAAFLIGFFQNHGLLQLRGRPQWRTIVGGSRNYLAALLKPIRDRVRLKCPVAAVRRASAGVEIKTTTGDFETFDHIVFATHADQTLRLLADATRQEREILQAFPYQQNRAILHTDASFLPKRKRAWASWNYHIPRDPTSAASITYDLSRLQNHATGSPLLLTLNDTRRLSPEHTMRSFTFHHPAYSQAAISAQLRYHEINGVGNTFYCGAYWGYGFHEDGVNSALAVARQFGIGLEACRVASTKATCLTAASGR